MGFCPVERVRKGVRVRKRGNKMVGKGVLRDGISDDGERANRRRVGKEG